MCVKLNDKYLGSFIHQHEYASIASQVALAHDSLHCKSGLGSEFTGWVELPSEYDKTEFSRIKTTAQKIRSDSEVFIVIGIGGSYLGTKAAIHFLNLQGNTPKIYFAGNNISATALSELTLLCRDKDFSINMISKSGTTTEPAIAFRVLRRLLIDKYGKDGAKSRIYCTTDKCKGTLKQLCDREGYETFAVPDDIGGRYSVLTAVGLLPVAVCGADIDKLMRGAQLAQTQLSVSSLYDNDCYKYAAIRNILYRQGKEIEVLVGYEPCLSVLNEWFKQLFGESEGKDKKGIFPASLIFSTDLHSMGQMMQDGKRNMFETTLFADKPRYDITICHEDEDIDGLNFLAGKTLSYVNTMAFKGTVMAHADGGVPNIILNIADYSEITLGYLFYFFEKACAISGYLLGINPFDQPGVEEYKKNMFALLGKPGYEELRFRLLKS